MLAALGACASNDADSTSRAEPARPPPGTLAALVAPPRSAHPSFTGDASDVERAFLARLEAFQRREPDTVLALSARTSAPGSQEDIQNFMDNYAVRLYRINAIDVARDTATVDYEDAIVGLDSTIAITTLLGQHDVWKLEDGAWKWSSNTVTAPGIPRDVATVRVQLRDGSPPRITKLPAAEFAFRLENRGTAPKGTFLLGVPADFDLQQLVPTLDALVQQRANGGAQLPAGVLELGATVAVPAGGVGTMVFSGRLPNGRYVLVTRADGDQGDVLPGEYTDFVVE